MASRFWVGGTGTWDATTTTHWSATSGGSGGASVPLSTDDVFFNGSSGTGTVSFGGALQAKTITCTGYAGGFAFTSGSLSVNGAVTLASTITTNFPAVMNVNASCTLTSAGKSTTSILVQLGAVLTQADAMVLTGTLQLLNGTWDTGSFAATVQTLSSNNVNTRTMTFGSSAITITGTGTSWNVGTNPLNLTVTANTAIVTMTGSSVNFSGVKDWNGMSVVQSGANTPVMQAGTVANYTRTGTAVKSDTLQLSSDLVVTGTFTVNGDSSLNRVAVTSNVLGTPRTITAATVSASNVDFQDIVGAGAASWNLSAITGLSGDLGGNSGITFTAPLTLYYKMTANDFWGQVARWTLATNGGGGAGRVPLPQDTAIIDTNSGAFTLTLNQPRVAKDIDFTGWTGTASFSSVATTIYGSLTFSSSMSITGSQSLTFAGRGSHTITSAGKPTAGQTNFTGCVGGTYTLQDDMSVGSGSSALSLADGILDLNGYTVSCSTFASNSGRTRSLLANGGTFVLTSTATTTIWNINVTGFTAISGSPNLTVGTASANDRTITGGGATYGTLTYTVASSSGALIITGSPNTWAGWTVNAGKTLKPSAANVNKIGVWNVNGAAGNLTTIKSNTAASATILRPLATSTLPFSSDYLSLQDTTVQDNAGGSGTGLWYAGSHSIDISGNTGWTFTAPPSGVTGTADFTGDGSLTTSGVPAFAVGASFGGDGVLSTADTPAIPGTGGLSGSGSLTTTAVIAVTATAALSGSGVLAASTTPAVAVAAALSGDGTLVTTATPAVTTAATLAGSGALTTTATVATAGSASFSGDGSLTTTATVSFAVGAALSGNGALTTSTVPSVAVAAALAGNGVLTTSAVSAVAVTVTLSGNGSLTVTGAPSTSGAATLAGSGLLTTTAIPTTSQTVSFTGVGVLTTAQVPSPTLTADFTGDGQLDAAVVPTFADTATFTGLGTLSTTGIATTTGVALIPVGGTLTAVAGEITAVTG